MIETQKKLEEAIKKKEFQNASQYCQILLKYSPKSKVLCMEYIKVLVNLGQIDEAKNQLNQIENTCTETEKYFIQALLANIEGNA